MKPRKETILELQKILKEEFGKDYDLEAIEKSAEMIIGYFNLLRKIHIREVRK